MVTSSEIEEVTGDQAVLSHFKASRFSADRRLVYLESEIGNEEMGSKLYAQQAFQKKIWNWTHAFEKIADAGK